MRFPALTGLMGCWKQGKEWHLGPLLGSALATGPDDLLLHELENARRDRFVGQNEEFNLGRVILWVYWERLDLRDGPQLDTM